jgi:hypothetical protein
MTVMTVIEKRSLVASLWSRVTGVSLSLSKIGYCMLDVSAEEQQILG